MAESFSPLQKGYRRLKIKTVFYLEMWALMKTSIYFFYDAILQNWQEILKLKYVKHFLLHPDWAANFSTNH